MASEQFDPSVGSLSPTKPGSISRLPSEDACCSGFFFLVNPSNLGWILNITTELGKGLELGVARDLELGAEVRGLERLVDKFTETDGLGGVVVATLDLLAGDDPTVTLGLDGLND